MNAITPFSMRNAVSAKRSPIHDFVEENWPALRYAADFLGGPCAAEIADRLFNDLAIYRTIGPLTEKRLDRIIRLLELESDTIDDGVFLSFAVAFDPAVETICLLADGLRDALERSILPSAQT